MPKMAMLTAIFGNDEAILLPLKLFDEMQQKSQKFS